LIPTGHTSDRGAQGQSCRAVVCRGSGVQMHVEDGVRSPGGTGCGSYLLRNQAASADYGCRTQPKDRCTPSHHAVTVSRGIVGGASY
jgi:hypothetical protein